MSSLKVLSVLLCLTATILAIPVEKNKDLPIILVPGLGGSQLWYHQGNPDNSKIAWVDLPGLIRPEDQKKFVDLMKLNYDHRTHTTSDQPGLKVFVPGFGNTSSVESLSNEYPEFTEYYVKMVKKLVDQGYVRGKNLRAAPFDFRKAPNEMEELFHNMQNLVEETVKSENKKAVIVCHSLGCPVFLTLLGQVSQEWKDKHIEVFVAIGAPWEGAVESLEAVISGVDFGQSVIKPKIVRELFRTMPSLYYLMPFGKLWGSKEVLVETKQKSYTSKDLLKLMVDLGSDGGNFAHLFLDAVTTRKKLGVPGVKTVCYHATGSATPARLVYHGTEGLNGDHEVINEDGDGTVNSRNIEVCRGWVGRQKQPVFIREIHGVAHRAMIEDSSIIDAIYSFASRSKPDEQVLSLMLKRAYQ